MSTVTDLPEFLTVEETARMLRLHPRTIRNRIKSGLLPAKQVTGGKSKLIAKADALALLVDAAPAPSINPLAMPQGRARAAEMLAQLGDDRDEEEQRDSWEKLQKALEENPVRFRRWNVETWEHAEGGE